MSATVDSPNRSQPFGRYLLLDQVAQGGMARVYRAVLRETSGLEKVVALKRIRRQLGEDPEFVTRFSDEARIASTLSHRNIVQVLDFGQVDGEYYLAMDLVDGPDLGTLIKASKQQERPIPVTVAIYLASELAHGLGAAHGRKDKRGASAPVVHRDVSPQNLLLSRSGEVKLTDFGIAKAADKVVRTRTGLVLGKCQYMAPEQATGQAVDSRADIFSAGCVLFQLLTGAPPFSGLSPQEILDKVLSAPIAAPSKQKPDLPPELDAIVSKCLQREVSARYPEGSSLARALEALLHRMAPDFSCDELAQFIATLIPPGPSTATHDAALTQPALDTEATAAVEVTPAVAEKTADRAAMADTLLDESAGWSPAKWHKPILLGLALLLGAAVGLLGGKQWVRSPPPPPLQRVLNRGDWRIEIKGLERSSDRGLLVLRLALARIDGRQVGQATAARLSLRSTSDATPQRARFWTASDGELLVAFPLRSRAARRHTLTFAPPAGAPLTLALLEKNFK